MLNVRVLEAEVRTQLPSRGLSGLAKCSKDHLQLSPARPCTLRLLDTPLASLLLFLFVSWLPIVPASVSSVLVLF